MIIKLAAFSAPAKVVQKIFNFAIGEYCRNLEYWIKQGYIKITDGVFGKLVKILQASPTDSTIIIRKEDFIGWKYYDKLKNNFEIKLNIEVITNKSRDEFDGTYDWELAEIGILAPLPTEIEDISKLYYLINQIDFVVKHEVTHFAQALLQEMSGQKKKFGLPAKSNIGSDMFGVIRNEEGYTIGKKDHGLIDVEFWPVLNNIVDYILVNELPKEDILKILKGTYNFSSGVVFTKFMKHLIINNKPRWRNAVRYIIKELVANKVNI